MIRQLALKLPRGMQRPLRRMLRRRPLPGSVRFGDLGGTSPIDATFGYGRGAPVDRLYIEAFLEQHRGDVQGRVLEVGDDAYSRQFGGTRITRQDILHVHAGNPAATIVGDMTVPGVLPAASFDCIILTQTLQFVFDLEAAIARLHDDDDEPRSRPFAPFGRESTGVLKTKRPIVRLKRRTCRDLAEGSCSRRHR